MTKRKLGRLNPANGGQFRGPYKPAGACLRNWLSRRYGGRVAKVTPRGAYWD